MWANGDSKTHRGQSLEIELTHTEATRLLAIKDALDTGRLNADAKVVTAREIAAVLFGAGPSRADVMRVGDLLTRWGCWTRGTGAYPHARSMRALVSAVAELSEQAASVQPPEPQLVLNVARNLPAETAR